MFAQWKAARTILNPPGDLYMMHCIERCQAIDRLDWGVLVLRRLEDRIRELCAKAIVARSPDELESIFSELKSALQEHTARLRKAAAAKLVPGEIGSHPERRSAYPEATRW